MTELTPEEEKLILIERLSSTILWGSLLSKSIEYGATKIEIDKVDTHLWKVVLITDIGQYMSMGNNPADALTTALSRCIEDKNTCGICVGDGFTLAFLSGRKFKCPGCAGTGKKKWNSLKV